MIYFCNKLFCLQSVLQDNGITKVHVCVEKFSQMKEVNIVRHISGSFCKMRFHLLMHSKILSGRKRMPV